MMAPSAEFQCEAAHRPEFFLETRQMSDFGTWQPFEQVGPISAAWPLDARAQQAGTLRTIGTRPLREPFGLLDHSDDLDLNHCLWLSETADLDRRAGRTGYPEVAHAHVGALGERLVVRDEGVGLNN